MLINSEKQIAFANDEFLELFRFVWDDIYEIPMELSPLPKELKEKIQKAIISKNWIHGEAMDIIGENYAYELNLSLIPVRNEKNETDSVICLLGQLEKEVEPIKTT